MDKYISFSPHYAGFCNVILSYELAFALAHITGRTLILPPSTFVDHKTVSHSNKKSWENIWDFFDKETANQEFNIIDMSFVPEYEINKSALVTMRSHTGNVEKYVNDLLYVSCTDKAVCGGHMCFVNDISSVKDMDDLIKFSSGRPVVDLNKEEKFIHFERLLFGHYFYHIYAGDKEQRNLLKDKINKTFTYKKIYYEIANQVKEKIGEYNAVHVRRGDFKYRFGRHIANVVSEENTLKSIENKFPKDIPLYICTDEKDKSFFKNVSEKYKTYFLNDFEIFDANTLEQSIIEQIICANAKFFIGTHPSTYSKRINIMRGITGIQSNDAIYLNRNILKSKQINDSPIPWSLLPEKKVWNWLDSSHPAWMKE